MTAKVFVVAHGYTTANEVRIVSSEEGRCTEGPEVARYKIAAEPSCMGELEVDPLDIDLVPAEDMMRFEPGHTEE